MLTDDSDDEAALQSVGLHAATCHPPPVIHPSTDVEGFFFFPPQSLFFSTLLLLLHIKFAGAYHELTVDWISCFKGGMLILTGGIECRAEKPTHAGEGGGGRRGEIFLESAIKQKNGQERFMAAQAMMGGAV